VHSVAAFGWGGVVLILAWLRPGDAGLSVPNLALAAALALIGVALWGHRPEWSLLALGVVLTAMSGLRLYLLALPPEERLAPAHPEALLLLVPWAVRCFVQFRRLRSLRVELACARAGGVPRIRLMV